MLRAVLSQSPAGLKAPLRQIASIIPLGWRRGAMYRKWSRFLSGAQWWPVERIREWQTEQLRHIVAYAYKNTVGYRELYDKAGIKPADIRSLDDAKFLPLTTKQLFQDNLEVFCVKHPLYKYITTGGSTGIPFGFYKNPANLDIEDAFMHAGWARAGWRPSCRSAILRGGFIGSQSKIAEYDSYTRSIHLSSYYLTAQTLPSYIEVCHKMKPQVLQAYPSSLQMLCSLLEDAGRVGELHFDLILLGSENLYDWQSDLFNRIFPRARFFSWYGQAETVILAPWCEHRRQFHIWPFYGFSEILDGNGEPVGIGAEGELVGTSFHSFGTPFIRYRTMDLAVRGDESCPACGRAFPMLTRISGRAQEIIMTATGRPISMTAINMHDDIFDQLRQFQFYQDQPGVITFKYIPKTKLPAEVLDRIRTGLLRKLGDDMKLSLMPVQEIPRSPAGKYRFLEQRLPIKYGDR